MKKRILIAGIGIIILMALFMTFRLRNKQDAGVLPVSGNVEVTEVNIAFKIPGRIVALLTDEGRTVKVNEKIAVLDSAEYESQVNQNRAVLRNAEATLDKARKDYERADVLYKNGAISSQQMDAAKTANDVTLSQVQQAAAALRTFEVKLKDTVIYSPVSGMVLRKNVEAGETVSAGTPVYTIGDLDNPWIKVYVQEAKLGLVKLGQKAEIRTDSYPGKIYEGTVTYISSEAEFTPKNVQTQEERVKLVYGVKVSVKNVNDELKPSMPADVKILLK
jgi:HlyD family secretion protein